MLRYPIFGRQPDYGALVGSDIASTSATLNGPREATITDPGVGLYRTVKGSVARSGCWYCEFDHISGADGTGYTNFGVVMDGTAPGSTLYGSQSYGWGGGDDAPYFNFTGAARLMMAVNTIERKVWIGTNGAWITNNPNTTVTPFVTMAATVCGPLAPAISTFGGGSISNRAAICFTRDQMRYEPPLNFIPIGEL